MSRILSQEEVRALLQQPVVGEAGSGPEEKTPDITTYDFRERERMPRTRLRYLQYLHDRFAQYLSVSLSAYLRNGSEVQLESIQQFSSRRVLQGLEDPTAIFLIDATVGGVVALVIDNELALALVDRLLGGSGDKPALSRALTEIEQNVLQGLVEVVMGALKQAWTPTVEIDLEVARVETRPALVTLEPPEEGRVILELQVAFGEGDGAVRGGMHVVLPMVIADKLSTELARDFGRDRDAAPEETKELRAMEMRLPRIPVTLAVELEARAVTAGDLVRLHSDHVLDLGRSLAEPALVKVGGLPKFEGALAMSHGRPAIEIRDELEMD